MSKLKRYNIRKSIDGNSIRTQLIQIKIWEKSKRVYLDKKIQKISIEMERLYR